MGFPLLLRISCIGVS